MSIPVNLIVEIDIPLKRKFKLYAIEHNTSMKKLIIDYIKTVTNGEQENETKTQ